MSRSVGWVSGGSLVGGRSAAGPRHTVTGVQVTRGDVALGAVITAATVLPAVVPYAQPWWVVLATMLASVPVVWRRVALLPVTAVVGGATTALALTYQQLPHSPLPPIPFGALACAYAFGATDMRRAWRLGAGTVFGATVIVSLAVPGENFETYRYVITGFVAAYALGVSTRARAERRAAEAERSRRLAEERASAVAQERARIARDMHDIVTHSVGLMVVQAEAGPLVVRVDPDKAEAIFETVAATGREAIAQLRHALDAVREPPADGAVPPSRPSAAAVADLVAAAREAGLRVGHTERGERRVTPAGVDAAAYRIVQESLTNALRHAPRDAEVRVSVDWCPDALIVRVADTGGGTGAHAGALVEGHGILGMRERVRSCGGTLVVDPRGFTVTATLPTGPIG